MASKVSALIEATTIAATDLFYSVVGGASRRVKAENVFATFTGSKHLFSYATLNAAVDAIASAQATLWITSSTTVAASKTVPSNITLKFTGTGVISVNVSQTLTINGPIEAPLRQIFTGSGVVRFGGNMEAAYPQWWGAAMDGTTDDSVAFQKAVDAFTGSFAGSFRGGIVRLIGPCAIGSTVLSTHSGVIIEGTGWGLHSDSNKRGYLRWIGTTAIPMLKFQDCVRAGVKSLRIIGKSSGTKPSAAVEFNQTGGGSTLDQPVLEDIWIGSYYLSDTDTGVQFTAGVLFTGNVNCDTGVFKNVNIQQCTTGVDNQNPNATVAHWDTLQIGQCTTGFKTVAPHNMISNFLCYLNDVDMEIAAQGVDWVLHDYVSEGSGRMLQVTSASPFRFLVIGGGFQADSTSKFTGNDQTSPNRRWMIDVRDAAGGNGAWIELKNFNLTTAGTPPIPVILTWGTSDGATVSNSTGIALILDGVRGFTSANFNVGSDNLYSSSRVVIFNRQSGNAAIAPQFNRYIFSPTESEDQAYQDLRFDIAGKATVYGGPVKVKRLATPSDVSVVATGGTGTTYGYRVSAVDRDGNETLASASVTVSGGATLSVSVYNTVNFNPVVGAAAYKIYGRTNGSELLMKTLTLAEIGDTYQAAWRDDGSLTPSGALPAVNQSGGLSVAGSLFLGSYTTTERDALTNVANGQIIYNSTTGQFQGRAAGAWVSFH